MACLLSSESLAQLRHLIKSCCCCCWNPSSSSFQLVKTMLEALDALLIPTIASYISIGHGIKHWPVVVVVNTPARSPRRAAGEQCCCCCCWLSAGLWHIINKKTISNPTPFKVRISVAIASFPSPFAFLFPCKIKTSPKSYTASFYT